MFFSCQYDSITFCLYKSSSADKKEEAKSLYECWKSSMVGATWHVTCEQSISNVWTRCEDGAGLMIILHIPDLHPCCYDGYDMTSDI